MRTRLSLLMILRLFRTVDDFFFGRISAQGFGLMRVLWALTALLWMGMQYKDVTEFYSEGGVLPEHLQNLILRQDWRFTLLDWLITPDAVMALFVLMLFFILCMLIGLAPRVSTIASVLLLFSFHERNPLPFGGGDTVLRVLGLLLMIAPRIDAFSVHRLRRQWSHWKGTGKLLSPDMMSRWPYRLLLWQIIVLYGTSIWFKLMGTMWTSGTAVASALHHPTFSRLPKHVVDLLTPFTPVVDFAALAWQASWLLLLIPRPLTNRIISHGMLKRGIILGGIWFHGSILIMMDAGSFSVAMFAAYAGLLLEDDFRALRDCINNQWRKGLGTSDLGLVTVLFDGRCAFCQKSIFYLSVMDNLRRLRFVNIYDTNARREVAPEIALDDLKKEMHVLVPQRQTEKTGNFSLATGNSAFSGFYAFRQLARHLPALWPLVPFLYIPGVPFVGRHVYAWIAARRHGARTMYVHNR